MNIAKTKATFSISATKYQLSIPNNFKSYNNYYSIYSCLDEIDFNFPEHAKFEVSYIRKDKG